MIPLEILFFVCLFIFLGGVGIYALLKMIDVIISVERGVNGRRELERRNKAIREEMVGGRTKESKTNCTESTGPG